MIPKHHTSSLFITALLAMFLLSAASCGRVGDIIPPGSVVPSAPGGVLAELKEGSVILVWEIPRRDTAGESMDDLAGFTVMRAELSEDEDDCPCNYGEVARIDLEYPVGAIVRGGRVAWSDSGETLQPGSRYSYMIVPYNTDGYEGTGAETGPVDYVMPPAEVAGLSAEPGEGQVRLYWEDVPDAAGYRVYRMSEEDSPIETPINRDPVTEPEFTDDGLTNNVTYYYAVSALAGTRPPYTEGPASAPVFAAPADRTPPPPPSGLVAVEGDGFVLLSWEPVIVKDLKGYHVYREDEGAGMAVRLTEEPTRHLTYRDETDTSVSHTYFVSAVDVADPPNESPRSEPATSH